MQIKLEMTEQEILSVLKAHVEARAQGLAIDKVALYVRSSQNYRATWEQCVVLILNEYGRAEKKGLDKWPDLDKRDEVLARFKLIEDVLNEMSADPNEPAISQLRGHINAVRNLLVLPPELKVVIDARS